MQNKIITLVALVVATAAFDAQALKRATNVRPAVTSTIGTTSGVKSVVRPVIKKVVISDAERNAIAADLQKAFTRAFNAAISLGTEEDAQAFMQSIPLTPLLESFDAKIKALPSKADLEAKAQEAEFEKRRQERALTAKDKDALRELAKTWKRDDVMQNYKGWLDKNNRDWDDAFLSELSGLAKE